MEELGRILMQFIYEGALWAEEAVAEEAVRWQISPAELKILLFLCCAPGMDTAKDVAHYCGFSKASVSGNVLKLTTRGLLTVDMDLKDRRFQHLTLTEQAEPILSSIRRRLQEEYRRVLLPLSETEREQLWSLLKRVRFGRRDR